MAFHNDSRVPLGPNMRDKNEHSRTTSNRYASCLRIPEDTTWPKIPERRMHENIVNNNKAPCVITLIGKNQKPRTVQLPHSQFTKAVPRKNDVERNDTICNTSAFRTTAKERNTSDDSRFKTTITPQTIITYPIKNDENKLNGEKEKETTEIFDNPRGTDNCDIKNNCESNTLQNKVNPSKQVNTDNSSADTNKPSVLFHREGDFLSDKSNKPNNSQDYTNFKISNNHEDCVELNNNNNRNATTNTPRREEEIISSNKSSSIPQENKKCINHQTKREWTSEKLKPTLLYVSDTTDSEVYSSETTRTNQMKSIMERRIQSTQKKLNWNCCNKVLKHPQIKKETGPCFCTHYQKLWTSKKFAHHSEPQIGSSFDSRRCSTAHSKSLHCCAKDFHRVASESDCRAMMYRSEIPRRCKEQSYVQDSLRNFHDLVACSDTLTGLHSRKGEESKQMEIGVKSQRIFETNCFNDFQKIYSKKDSKLVAGAPQEKKRKYDNENKRNYDNDALFIFSSMDNQDAKSNSFNGMDNAPRGNCDIRNSSFGIRKESRIKRNTAANDSLKNAISPHDDDNNSREKNHANNRILKLKRAIFLGSILYALILSLPTLYDYFFYEEEFDNYEEQTYFEIMVDFMVSSFQETFSGLFDFISKIFFQSRTCRKCSAIH